MTRMSWSFSCIPFTHFANLHIEIQVEFFDEFLGFFDVEVVVELGEKL